MEFQSLCIFCCILTLLIILIKPLTTKAHDRRASGDCGTSGVIWNTIETKPRFTTSSNLADMLIHDEDKSNGFWRSRLQWTNLEPCKHGNQTIAQLLQKKWGWTLLIFIVKVKVMMDKYGINYTNMIGNSLGYFVQTLHSLAYDEKRNLLDICLPPIAKAGDIETYLSVCPSVCPSHKL